MNVAIMGAGLSGLACAITLEKMGVTPTIFEKRSQELIKPLKQSYKYSLALRRAVEKLDNNKLDRLVRLIDTELANNLITNPYINLMKLLGFALRPYQIMKEV